MVSTLSPSPCATANDSFDGGRGYLAACTAGLPSRATRAAVIADVEAASRGMIDISAYSATVERSRELFARLVGIVGGAGGDRIAGVGVHRAHRDRGARRRRGARPRVRLLVDGHAVRAGGTRHPRAHRARCDALAEAIGPQTSLVAFSLVQSATGEIADAAAIVEAAHRHGARTFCDATQAVGWLPVEASRFDALVCHAYKWLCAPRGVAFLAIGEELQQAVTPQFAGWYAGADPWASCYGGEFGLAPDARRFDVSPAWQAFVGAEPALEHFASLDCRRSRATRRGSRPSSASGWDSGCPIARAPSSRGRIPMASDLARLAAAGITASGRSGRARVAFHVFNDGEDVDLAVAALGR